MDMAFKQRFIDRWQEYFPTADLPIAFYYTDEEGRGELPRRSKGSRCLICALAQVRDGRSLAFDVDAVRCGGGKRSWASSRASGPTSSTSSPTVSRVRWRARGTRSRPSWWSNS